MWSSMQVRDVSHLAEPLPKPWLVVAPVIVSEGAGATETSRGCCAGPYSSEPAM